MYFAPISQATKYNYLDDKFQAAYKWLAETDLDNTPAGSYPVCEGVTANVQEYTTFPASEGSFETHDKFFDIQYVISGKEQFGVCKREGLILKEDHPENDLKFYEEPAMSGTVLLLPGDMMQAYQAWMVYCCLLVFLPQHMYTTNIRYRSWMAVVRLCKII